MKISDSRYGRDRLRFDLALRFIQHEARTHTIRVWTGLTDDCIRNVFRSYVTADGEKVPRHRGKSPHQAAFFTRSPQMSQETAVLASILYMLGVMPAGRMADAQRALPGVQRGEALCEAFESYSLLVQIPRISFEHAVFLVTALARGDQITTALCSDCRGLIVVDRFAGSRRRCLCCEQSAQGKLAL